MEGGFDSNKKTSVFLVLSNIGNGFLLLNVQVMWLYMLVEHHQALLENNAPIRWNCS